MDEQVTISAIARIFYDRISKGKTKSDGTGTVWTIEDVPTDSMKQQVQALLDNQGSV